MSLTVEEATEHLRQVGTDLSPQIAEAVGALLQDAVDAGAELDHASSGSSVSLRWIVADAWASILLVSAEKWQCIELNGPRSGRGAEVTSAAERALARALPLYGGTPGQRPSYELAALALADSRLALREAFEEIGSAALSSQFGHKGDLPSTPWDPDELVELRRATHPDTVALMDQLSVGSPRRFTLGELGEQIGRPARSVSAQLGGLSGLVRARFQRENWPFQVEKTSAGWFYWMEEDQAAAWRDSWTPGITTARPSTRSQLAELLEQGLVRPGDPLVYVQTRLGNTHNGEVLDDGRIRTRLGDYTAPSTALADLVGFSINGWKHWKHEPSGMSLAELRRRL